MVVEGLTIFRTIFFFKEAQWKIRVQRIIDFATFRNLICDIKRKRNPTRYGRRPGDNIIQARIQNKSIDFSIPKGTKYKTCGHWRRHMSVYEKSKVETSGLMIVSDRKALLHWPIIVYIPRVSTDFSLNFFFFFLIPHQVTDTLAVKLNLSKCWENGFFTPVLKSC